jgi:hypothetical protein
MASGESSYSDAPLLAERFAMEFDAFDFLEGVRREIALAAMRTTDDGHVLNDKQLGPFAITPRNPPHPYTALSTDSA